MKCSCFTSFIATSLALSGNPIALDDPFAYLWEYTSGVQNCGFAQSASWTSAGGRFTKTWIEGPRQGIEVNMPKLAFSSSVAAATNCSVVLPRRLIRVNFTALGVETGPGVTRMASMICLRLTDCCFILSHLLWMLWKKKRKIHNVIDHFNLDDSCGSFVHKCKWNDLLTWCEHWQHAKSYPQVYLLQCWRKNQRTIHRRLVGLPK